MLEKKNPQKYQVTVFNIDNKKCFLRTKIIILQWFLKDQVTLKTEVMAAKNWDSKQE